MGLGRAAKTAEIHAQPVYGYCTVDTNTNKSILLDYPDADPSSFWEYLGFWGADMEASGAKASLSADDTPDDRPRGRSFHNHHFVHYLRDIVQKEKNIDYILGEVKNLIEEKGKSKPIVRGVSLIRNGTTKREELRAKFTVVCNGRFSSFRRTMTGAPKITVSYFVGYTLNHPADQTPLPHPYHGHVFLTRPTPLLMYQISPTETRVLVDVPAKRYNEGNLDDYFLNVIAPQLPADHGLRQIFIDSVRTQQHIACANTGIPVQPFKMRRAISLGDTFNMRHPLTGGGMTVALRDVECLANNLERVNLDDERQLAAALRSYAAERKGHAASVNILANALYRVFTHLPDNPASVALRDACFNYLASGGVFTNGPVGLLAGLTPLPGVLIFHYFIVAFYALYRTLAWIPTPSKLVSAYQQLHRACQIVFPLIRAENVTFLAWKPVQFVSDLLFPWKHVDDTTFV